VAAGITRWQAELVIDFINICERQRKMMEGTQKPPYHLTPDMFDARMDYWAQVGQLNAVTNDEDTMSTLITPHYSPMVASADRLQCTGFLLVMAILANIVNANGFILESGILSV
jgi:hypothetical protein